MPLLRQIEVLTAQGKLCARSLSGSGYTAAEIRDELLNGEISLQPERSTDRHRAMAKALQDDQIALGAQLQTAGTADIRDLGSPSR